MCGGSIPSSTRTHTHTHTPLYNIILHSMSNNLR
ncbi:GSCOCG00005863001-RA-CDS [Cotesia congregata]|nr:GSCOCG00005863001-RA-CDS [Cotesia congregata]